LAVNGHPSTLGANPKVVGDIPKRDVPAPDTEMIRSIVSKKVDINAAPEWRKILRKEGAHALAKAVRKHPRLLFTDTTWRDAHQSLLATRMRTYNMLKSAEATNAAYASSDVFSLEMWGGATFDVCMRFLEKLHDATPDVAFQMLLRGANVVGYTVRKCLPCFYMSATFCISLTHRHVDFVSIYAFCKQAYESGIDIFRVFDSLNYIENMRLGIQAVVEGGGFCEAAICYTGDVTNTSPDYKYSLKYYLDYAAQLVALGAHALAVKDMAGLLTPRAAKLLVSELRKAFPDTVIHVHTHDTGGVGVSSMVACFEAGADIVDGAIDAMSSKLYSM